MFIYYFVFISLLFGLELLYLKLADRYSIIDKPNERSSHVLPTIRGGGIIFILAAIGFSLVNQFAFPYLILALILIGIVSFLDDLKGLPRRVRFFTHMLAIFLLLVQSDFLEFNWTLIPLFIFFIGIVNAYNFMDGINGITGFFSLAVLLPFWYFEQDALYKEFFGVIILSAIVFLFFNARVKARCFAGDIGSVGMAIIVLFIILHKIVETGNWLYIFTLLVYGVDSIFTIGQRLLQGENIFNAHRKHFYQLLANEYKLPHLLISLTYAFLQLGLNEWLFIIQPSVRLMLFVTLGICFFYMVLKIFLLKKLDRGNV